LPVGYLEAVGNCRLRFLIPDGNRFGLSGIAVYQDVSDLGYDKDNVKQHAAVNDL